MTKRRASLKTITDRTGFTLLELMAVVGIFGILVALSIPPIYRSMDQSSSRQSADALAGRLRLARSQSLMSQANVMVYFNRDGVGTYTVHVDNGGGTGVPTDPQYNQANRNNGQIDPNEALFEPVAIDDRIVFGYVPGGMTSRGEFLNAAISFGGSPQRVIFRADGTCNEDGWICLIPEMDFFDQHPGRDFLVELTSSTGEVRVNRTVY